MNCNTTHYRANSSSVPGDPTRQLGGALELIHDGNIIHADIKPENIILTAGSKFVLFDFGISRRYSEGRSARTAVVAVSPGYSPPEQYHASKALTPATDVYSLAATLYALLTLHAPPEAIQREKGEPLPPIRGINNTVTHSFSMALQQALELDPQKRPQSVDVFLHALEHGSESRPLHLDTAAALRFSVEKLGDFAAHRGGIFSLLLHPQQPLILAGSRTGSVGRWSWQGEGVGLMRAHESALCGFAVSPTGSLLATAGQPGEVRLWDLADGRLVSEIRSGVPAVRSLAFYADGETLAVGTTAGTVEVYLAGHEHPTVFLAHSGDVNALSVSPDGTLLASGGQDGHIQLWDLTSGERKIQFSHQKPVLHLQFSQDSQLLLSGSSDYTTRIWEIQAGLELRRYREHGASVYAVSFTCDPDVIVSGCGDRKLRFYRLSSGRTVSSVEADGQFVGALACAAAHPVLASAGGDGRICIWQFNA